LFGSAYAAPPRRPLTAREGTNTAARRIIGVGGTALAHTVPGAGAGAGVGAGTGAGSIPAAAAARCQARLALQLHLPCKGGALAAQLCGSGSLGSGGSLGGCLVRLVLLVKNHRAAALGGRRRGRDRL
jgi:hypothetical protein